MSNYTSSMPDVQGDFEPGADAADGTQTWMISFADLMAILLTFMVMGYSMAPVDDAVWSSLTGGLASSFGKIAPQEDDTLSPDLLARIDGDYAATYLVSRLPGLSENDIQRQGSEYFVDVVKGDWAAIAEALSRLDEPFALEVVGRLPIDGSQVQGQIAWERTLAEGLQLRDRLKGAGLESTPDLRVRMISGDRAAAGPWIVFGGEVGS